MPCGVAVMPGLKRPGTWLAICAATIVTMMAPSRARAYLRPEYSSIWVVKSSG